MPDLLMGCGYPWGNESSIVLGWRSPLLLPVFTFPAPCSNTKPLMTLNKLIWGLNSLQGAGPGVRGQLSIPD